MKDFDKTQNILHFEQLNQKYVSLCEKYCDSFESFNEEISTKGHRYEYSRGGLSIHRGFYSPSSLDLVVLGCNRGHLLKKKPKSNNPSYEYIFDDDDNLICVKKFDVNSAVSVELLLYEDNRVLSLSYDLWNDSNHLSFISECHYDGKKLMRYENAQCLPWDRKNKCIEINLEETNYENGLMKSMLWSRYSPSTKLFTQNLYVFSRDEEGYLTTYTMEELTNPNSIYKGFDSNEVLKRRK